MKHNIVFSFRLALLMSLMTFQLNIARASHAMGADITYTCLGNNQYEFTMSFYRDCFGIPAPLTMGLDISNGCGLPNPTVTLQQTGPVIQISPVCPTATTTCNGGTFTGIEQYTYTGVVTLPGPCADWTFGHAESARNAAITTITGAGSDNLYVYTSLNNTSGLCNNSPTFSNAPVPFACVGQRFCFNHGAFDLEGDSLAFQLITPLNNPGSTVTYLAGFSNLQPVLSNPPVSFDPISGDICMNPTQQDVTVFAVLVNEYRNGVLIGQVERDIQLTVLQCANHLPSITGMNGAPFFDHTICANTTDSFYIASIDPDAANTTVITWDQSIAGATMTMTGGHRDSAVFVWHPTTADISANPYCFTVTVQDDNCPYLGTQVYAFCITVQGVDVDAGPDVTVTCGATTNLTATASNGNGTYNYLWNPSGIAGPTLSGVGVGTYTVEVTSGTCHDYDTVNVVPGNGVPVAAFSFSNNCSGAPIQFTDNTTISGSGINSWTWDFGDFSTSALQNPTHQYTANGTYNVSLIVTTGAGCADTITQQITINTNVPTALFSAPAICQNGTMNFTDQSSGSPINWSWNFGDPSGNNTSVLQNTSHIYATPGNYTVTLIVTNAAGCSNQVQQSVTVNSNPTVSVTDPQICVGDQATLSAPAGFTTYNWDNVDFNQSITVTPVTTTNYSLTVTDNNSCQAIDVVTVTVNPLPIPDAGLNQTICAGTNTTITATGGGTYNWTPGNISLASTVVNPITTTTYIVTVTSAAGCIASDQMTITVNPIPVVDANGDQGICKGSSATLNVANGSGNIVWNPGGFNTSSITVAPLTTTTYTLTISDAIGCAASDTFTINVNPIPVAAFTTSAPVCINNTVSFTDQSSIPSGAIASWIWDLGNGSTASTQNASSLYTGSGSFNAQLIITSNVGCKDTVINAFTVFANPIADAGLDQHICPGANATLTGSGGVSYNWTPGNLTNASINVSPGTDTQYQLTVTDANGCQNTDAASVIINPVPVANAGSDQSICFGTTTTLNATGGGTYVWTPGSANTSSLNITPNSTGTYSVTVTNSDGCTSSDAVTIQVNPIPVAAFASSGAVCEDYGVSFTDNSNVASGTIASWNWNFGNGVSSATQNPSLVYTDPGNFTVNLVVISDQGCSDTVQMQQAIWATPVSAFVNTNVCLGLPIDFTGTSTISDGSALDYAWNLGDNSTSAQSTFAHQYANYGAYPVTLITASVNGCRDTVTALANVFALPDAQFSVGTICEETNATFQNTSTIGDGAISTYFWTFGDNGVGTSSSPLHTYSDPGLYQISLLVSSDHGCQDSTYGTVKVLPNPVVDFETEDVCQGFEVNFRDLSIASLGNIVTYQWNFGDGTIDPTQNPIHTYLAPGFYTVSLMAVNDSGCSATMTQPDAVHIFPSPVAQFNHNSSEANDLIPMVNFVNQTSSAGLFFWDFGDGDTSMMYSPTHTYPSVGTYEVQLITIDLNGCVDTTYRLIEIRPNSSVYIPNTFTPNGDTRNDLFQVFTWNVKNLDVSVYDRWGLKICEWNSLAGGWDGNVNGNPAQADTYVYRVSTVDINDKKEVRVGHVSLVR
ncbi:MAG: PKD domain-containing protein [Bacteroidetes bacterium]|nr:PKD domain-containing protein [Bacteroidota bacterium]